MPVYFVTGKLGSGKTLSMVGRMRDYLNAGRGVVSNIDIDIRKLCKERPALMPIRLPDKPTVEDLLKLGAAHRTCREELNGGIFLDECGTWLNSRAWGDKGRARLIDFLLHTRKLGWDVFFIIQSAAMMDKQIRDALCEYHVTCRRLDRLKIPFFGKFVQLLSFGRLKGNLPKLHVATVHYGIGPAAFLSEVWRYLGRDLYDAYTSSQIVDEGGQLSLEISDEPAFPTSIHATPLPGAIKDRSALHSLVWYQTPDEVEAAAKAAPTKLKPKLDLVRWIQRLPADRRLPAMRRLGLAA